MKTMKASALSLLGGASQLHQGIPGGFAHLVVTVGQEIYQRQKVF
jgi:hypothetical protein